MYIIYKFVIPLVELSYCKKNINLNYYKIA